MDMGEIAIADEEKNKSNAWILRLQTEDEKHSTETKKWKPETKEENEVSYWRLQRQRKATVENTTENLNKRRAGYQPLGQEKLVVISIPRGQS